MYSSDDSDDGDSFPNDLYQSPAAGLKPALDSIFAEVQANIPTIDSYSDSEVSSDEEPVIFNRSGDLTSLSLSTESVLSEADKEIESKISTQNDLVISKHEENSSSALTNGGLPLPNDLQRSVNNHIHETNNENTLSKGKDNESTALDSNHVPSNISTACSIQTQMNEPKVMCSNHSHDSVVLSFSQLADIDFDVLMKRFNDVSVSSWSEANSLDLQGPSDEEDGDDAGTDSDGSDELMRQLINLSKRQLNEGVTATNPLKHSKTQNDTQSHDTDFDIPQQSKSGIKEFGVQANSFYNNAGTMAATFVSSIGVSTSFDASSYIDIGPTGSNTKTGDRGTVFIDLRNQKIEPLNSEKADRAYPSSIQRILGISEVESSSSSSEDENDMELWHEQRRRIKQALIKTNQACETSTVKIRPINYKSTRSETTTLHTKESVTKSDQVKTIMIDLSSALKAEKDLEIKFSGKEKSEMGEMLESENHDDDDDDYIMIKIDDSLANKRVAEFVPVSLREHRGILNTPVASTPKLCEVENQDDCRIKEVNKRIASILLVNKYLESEISEASEVKEALIDKENSRTKWRKSLPKHEPSLKLEEKRAVKEESVVSQSVKSSSFTVNKPRNKADQTNKDKKQDKEITDTASKKKESKFPIKCNEQKILNAKLKAKKLRTQHKLESVKQERESRTVGGRVCMSAPETPIVFDLDASYEPTPSSLPDTFSSKNYLLLLISLSTCGEVIIGGDKGNKGGKRGNQIDTDCHCFSALIAWLLSMVPVPENSHYQDNADLCNAPFHVIGLQQTWHVGELSIKVGICNRSEFQGTRTKQGGKSNNFQMAVAKFLRSNTLCSVLTKILGTTPVFVKMPFSQKNLTSLLTINPDPQAMIRVFGAEPGFYWKTFEVEDTVDASSSNIGYCGPDIQNTTMLVQFLAHHDPLCMYDILNRVWKQGLDVAGIRLLYTHGIPLEERPGLDKSSSNVLLHEGPLLALAIRGPHSLSRWIDVVGPRDTWLARRTDPSSLRAVYGPEDKEDHLFYVPRNTNRANVELARWFGGRVPPGDTINIGSDDLVVKRTRSGSRGKKDEQLPTNALHTPLLSPPCTLVASTESLVVIVASPLILPRCLGIILAICNSRGFILYGIRRIRFHPQNQNDTSRDILGLTPAQLPIFCPSKCCTDDQSASPVFIFDRHSPDSQTPFSRASSIICFRKENGIHHAMSLVAALAEEIIHMEYLPREVTCQGVAAISTSCFAVIPYSENLGHILGNKMKQGQNSNLFAAASLSHSFYSNPEMEQVCVFTLLKEKATRFCHDILDQLTLDSPRPFQMNSNDFDKIYCGFELLGVKFVSSMTMHQAKEFTPYEIGDKLWQSSLRPLTTGPALICALRGVNAFERLRHFIHSYYGCSPKKRPLQSKDSMCPDMFMSSTPEIAYRQLTAIFFEHELHADHSMRKNQHHFPRKLRDLITNGVSQRDASPKLQGKKSARSSSPARWNANSNASLSPDDVPIIASLLAGPCLLTTLCVIKPDAIPRHVGKVLKRLTREGFTVVNMKMDYLSEGDALALVLRDWGCSKDDQDTHVKHLTSGPVVILSLQRENAVGKLLDVLGPSNPDECRQESQFYLRGSYGLDRIRNALYGSCSYDNAVKDHKLLFIHGVCCSPTITLKAEGIPCVASDEVFDADSPRTLVDVSEESKSPCSTDNELSTVYLPPSLLEVNCILLLPNLLKIQGGTSSVRTNPGFTEVIDGLISVGLQIVGLRMVRLNDSQAAYCTRMYGDSIPGDVKQHQMASQLSKGPLIVMAVVRDGAVTSFDTLLGSPLKSTSLATRYGKNILAARSFQKARRLVECFFDHLMPNKKSQIEYKEA